MGLLRDLFEQAAKLTNDDDDETCNGTVVSFPLFRASEDASLLDRAINAPGVEEGAIIDLLVKRSNEQRQEIKAAYLEAFGKALDESLASVLKGDLEELALALLMAPAQYDAHLLRKAMKGFGTDEDILIEILVSRSNAEIREIKNVYKKEYERDLEEDLDSENTGHFEDALLNLCKGTRSEETKVDSDLADSDAQTLFNAGEDRAGTNDTVFIHIFTTRSNAELRKIFQKYGKYSDTGMADAIDGEMSGHVEDCLVAIAKCAINKPSYFAEKLHQAMEGYGTRTKALIRLLVSRSEKDMVKVEKEYKKLYQKSLQQDILVESHGVLEAGLVALCGKAD